MSVVIHEIVKIAAQVVEIYEGVFHRENFKKSPLGKIIEEMFALGKQSEDDDSDLMQRLVNLLLNSFYGVQNQKDNIDFRNVNLNIGCKQNTIILF